MGKNEVILLSISLIACLLVSIVRRKQAKTESGMREMHLFNALVSVTATATFLIWGGFGECSKFTLLIAVIMALVTVLQSIACMKALETGPLSYTSVIQALSTVIPTLSGVMFFSETLEWPHYVGITLMLVSFVLSVEKKADEKKANLKWLIYCILSFFTTGAVGVIQKVHQSSVHKTELNALLIIAFALSVVFSVILMLATKKSETANDEAKSGNNKLLLFAVFVLICGICTAVNNKLNLHLSGVIDAAVFFPTINGGGLVLAAVYSAFVLKEKLTLKQWIGVILGIVSVIFLCNPF